MKPNDSNSLWKKSIWGKLFLSVNLSTIEQKHFEAWLSASEPERCRQEILFLLDFYKNVLFCIEVQLRIIFIMD